MDILPHLTRFLLSSRFMCMSVVPVWMWRSGVGGELDSLALEFRMVVDHHMGAGNSSQSSVRAATAPTHGAISPALTSDFPVASSKSFCRAPFQGQGNHTHSHTHNVHKLGSIKQTIC